MIYLSSNSGELFKQVLLLNPLDMFALANLLCPSLALPPFRARPPPTKFFHSVPSPDSCFSKERGTANGWMDARRNSAQTAWGWGSLLHGSDRMCLNRENSPHPVAHSFFLSVIHCATHAQILYSPKHHFVLR